MPTWLQVMFGLLPLLTAGFVLGWWWGPRRWDAATDAMRARLLAQARHGTATYTASDLEGLPSPVVHYFRHVLKEGQPIVARARVTWAGQFNMGRPGADKWVPFTAVQDFVPAAPGMLWDARIAMGPGLSVRVRDGFVDGRGSMQASVLGLYRVVDKAGTPELGRASLQRYLAEATWLPTALLPSQGVRWTGVDDTRALATLRTGSLSASVEFRFDAEGRPTSTFVPDRLFDDGKSPPAAHRWQGRNLTLTTAHGMVVPGDATVEWLLPAGTYAYWKGRPVAITYE